MSMNTLEVIVNK